MRVQEGLYVFGACDVFGLPMCILISCSSVLCVLMALDMFKFVKVMSSLINVMCSPPPPWLCSPSGRMVV